MILGLHITQIFIIVVLLVAVMALGWMWIAGDREGEMVDDDATMDVQNHQGDSRPTR